MLGVKSEDIVILAAYVGQLRKLRVLVSEAGLEVGQAQPASSRDTSRVSRAMSGRGFIQ